MLKKWNKGRWIELYWYEGFSYVWIEWTRCSVSNDWMESCPFVIVKDWVQTSKVQHINMYLTLIYVFFFGGLKDLIFFDDFGSLYHC